MAASCSNGNNNNVSRWRTRLAAALQRRDGGEGGGEVRACDAVKNVLGSHNSRVYAWSPRRRDVLVADAERSSSGGSSNAVDDGPEAAAAAAAENYCEEVDADKSTQTLVPSCPPIYDIQSIVVDPTGQRLALVGRNGVNVMELPKNPRGGSARSLCSSVEIAERFFLSNPNCFVLRVRWHPRSATHTHLLVLFSNNYLRMYDSLAPSAPVQSFQLGPVPVFRLSPSSPSSFGVALGDAAVDFDLGRPLGVSEGPFGRGLLAPRLMDPDALVWPLYVLGGNGDVFSLWITDPKYSHVKSEVKGPLTMHPPAEDNYGVDASSILCLPSTPPILAIATGSGMLYHAIVLENDDGGEDREQDSTTLSDMSWSSSKTSKTISGPDVSLYVYESAELELIPNPSLTAEALEEDLTCPIRLHKDPTTMLRYHCSHSAGVHTVALPIISQLEYLNETNSSETSLDVFSTIESQTCIIEHLICTRPLTNSPPSPVIGLAVVYGHSLGAATLLCLKDPCELVTLQLVPTYLNRIPDLLMDPAAGGDRSIMGGPQPPSTGVTKEPFDQHIRVMLQRKISNPIFKSNPSAELTPEECIQLVNRSTRILREEYIEKQDLAREKIQERVKVLRDLKKQQLVEIKAMTALKNHLSAKAEGLAEKHEELRDAQDAIVKRIERVLRALLKQTPSLSDAERMMGKELKTMEEKVKLLKNSLRQVRAKQNYQSSVIARQETNLKLQKSRATPGDAQIKRIREFLAEESQTLAELTEKMRTIQTGLGL